MMTTVSEVDVRPLPSGQPPVVEQLQQDVQHLGVRLLDSSEEHDRYGRRRTASVSWPASS